MADTPIKDYEKLDAQSKATIAANARSQGITPQEYLASRGGVYESGYYGDTPEFRRLSEADYAAAQAKGSGAINTALFNQIKEAYKNNPNLIEDPYLRLAYQNKTITLDQLMQGLNPDTFGKRGFGTLTTGQTRQSIGAMADGTPIYGFGSDGKPITDPNGTIYSTTSASDAITKFNSGAQPLGFDSSATGATGVPTGTATGPSLARDTFKNTLALFFGAAEMNKAWASELYNIVSKFYLTGSTVDESLNLALQDARNNPNLAEFTKRFKGIYDLQDLRQQGKPVTVPTIAEYVNTQSQMADLLTSSGLKDVATEDFTSSLIGKGLSYSTVADRLVKVFDRIDRAPKVIKDTLSRYYPTVDRTTLAKTLLLGEKGVKQLQDELAGYEILSAAEAQGIAATGATPKIGGVTEARAREYGALGETFESITPKFSQVAIATPRVSQLAGFSRTEDIGQTGVEKAVISRSAKELQQLEELTKQEEARFAGKAGRAELGLASQRRANRAF